MPRFISAWFKKHRSDIYGAATIVGLILTVIAIPKSCSGPTEAPESASPIRTIESTNSPIDKRRIVEHSAGEITGTSKELPNSHYSEDRIEELFLNRWIGEAGWKGVVFDLPRKAFDEKWEITVWEDNTGERFTIESENEEVSDLRDGDRILIVDARIARISRSWDGDAFITLDSVSLEVLAPISRFSQWWKQYRPYLIDSFTAPLMWIVYWWWSMMILLYAPYWIARVKYRINQRKANKQSQSDA